MATPTTWTDMSELRQEMEKCDYVRFTLADIHGVQRGKTVPGRNAHLFLEHGMPFYAGVCTLGIRSEITVTIQNVMDVNHGNCYARPVPDTFHILPWAGQGEYRIGEVLCDTYWKESGIPQELCPRGLANKQLKKLEEIGFRLFSGTEWEFLILDKKSGKPVTDGNDIFSNFLVEERGKLLYKMEKQLYTSGVDSAYIHTEHAPGGFEFPLTPAYGIRSADMSFNFKEGVREICSAEGYQACFVSKPYLDRTGNGGHFNHSIWDIKTGTNAFYDPSAENKMSENFRYWMGGLIKHGAAISALCSPSVNCFRRLHQPWSPTEISWDFADRYAAFRVKNEGPSGTYVENRLPGGIGNPYLVMAATIAAGVDGIVNKIPCPPKGNTRDTIILPKTFPEALDSLEADKEFVETLSAEFVETFIKVKKELELTQFPNSDPGEATLTKEREYYSFLS